MGGDLCFWGADGQGDRRFFCIEKLNFFPGLIGWQNNQYDGPKKSINLRYFSLTRREISDHPRSTRDGKVVVLDEKINELSGIIF